MLYFSTTMKVAYNQSGELITLLRKHHRGIAVFFIIIFSSLIFDSCAYYKKKVLSGDKITLKKINKNIAKGKHFVLETYTETWKADSVKFIDEEYLSMDLRPIKGQYIKGVSIEDKLAYLDTVSKTRVKAGVKTNNRILQQLVIIHLQDSSSLEAGYNSFAISDIEAIEVYDADIGKSLGYFAIGFIGAMLIMTLIIALTKSSCPFLYVYDGEDYQLAAETFGGAIYPGLERSDFVRVSMAQPDEGFYKFKIRNELKEIQFINKVRLIEAKVPDRKTLNIDQNGVLHTIGTPVSHYLATSDSQ
jgi:hypothetical protein